MFPPLASLPSSGEGRGSPRFWICSSSFHVIFASSPCRSEASCPAPGSCFCKRAFFFWWMLQTLGESVVIPPPAITSSPPSHFSSESDVPLSQWLPGYFWRSPKGSLRDGPLLRFTCCSCSFPQGGGQSFQASAYSPIFRFMLTVYDALYEQVESMAFHHLGEMAIRLLSQRFS